MTQYAEGVYAVYDTESNSYVQYKTKVAWGSISAAKNAWNLHDRTREINPERKRERVGTFNTQSRFVIKNLIEETK